MKVIIDSKRMVDISQLYKGLTVKNYNDMCKLLGCEPCVGRGNDKIGQIKNWQRYFNFEKSGHKFIITDIYNTPLPVVDGRRTKEGKYNKYIESLLIKYLLSRKSNSTNITKRELYSVLGMVNKNYDMLDYDDNYTALQKELGANVSIFNIQQFHQRVENRLSKLLYSALESMAKRNIIRYEKKFIINVSVSEGDNSSGYKSVVASPHQESVVLETQQDVLNEFGYENISQVALKYRVKEFYEKVNEQLNEKYEWLGYYTQIYIVLLKDVSVAQYLTANDICELSYGVQREQFNKLILQKVNQQARTKYEKYQEQSIEGFLDGIIRFQYDETYLEDQFQLSDFMTDLKKGDRYREFWLAIDKQKEK